MNIKVKKGINVDLNHCLTKIKFIPLLLNTRYMKHEFRIPKFDIQKLKKGKSIFQKQLVGKSSTPT